jgi:hypothetical protein
MFFPSFFVFFILKTLSQLPPSTFWTDELQQLDEIEDSLIDSLEFLSQHSSNLVSPHVIAQLELLVQNQLEKVDPTFTPFPLPSAPPSSPPSPSATPPISNKSSVWFQVPLILYDTDRSVQTVNKFVWHKRSTGVIPNVPTYDGWIVADPHPILSFMPILQNENKIEGVFLPAAQKVKCEVTKGKFGFLKGGTNEGEMWVDFTLSEKVQFIEINGKNGVEFERLRLIPEENQGDKERFCIQKFILVYRKDKE